MDKLNQIIFRRNIAKQNEYDIIHLDILPSSCKFYKEALIIYVGQHIGKIEILPKENKSREKKHGHKIDDKKATIPFFEPFNPLTSVREKDYRITDF